MFKFIAIIAAAWLGFTIKPSKEIMLAMIGVSVFSLVVGILLLKIFYPERNLWNYIMLDPSLAAATPFIAFWTGIGASLLCFFRIYYKK